MVKPFPLVLIFILEVPAHPRHENPGQADRPGGVLCFVPGLFPAPGPPCPARAPRRTAETSGLSSAGFPPLLCLIRCPVLPAGSGVPAASAARRFGLSPFRLPFLVPSLGVGPGGRGPPPRAGRRLRGSRLRPAPPAPGLPGPCGDRAGPAAAGFGSPLRRALPGRRFAPPGPVSALSP